MIYKDTKFNPPRFEIDIDLSGVPEAERQALIDFLLYQAEH